MPALATRDGPAKSCSHRDRGHRPVGKRREGGCAERKRNGERERDSERAREREKEELSSELVRAYARSPLVIYTSAKSYASRCCRVYANLVQRSVVASRPFEIRVWRFDGNVTTTTTKTTTKRRRRIRGSGDDERRVTQRDAITRLAGWLAYEDVYRHAPLECFR